MNQLQKNVFLTYLKPTILLIATFCLGSIVASGVARLLEKTKDTVTDNNKLNTVDSRDVFVLKNPIREGKEILPENLTVVPLHKDRIPRGAVKTYQQIDGRKVKVELLPGTVLLDEYFVTKTASNAVAKGFIPPGYHLVPIQVHEPAIDGQNSHPAVLPGDQVDIIIVQKDVETGEESKEFVLMERIPVLDAVWDELGNTQMYEKKGTVSLLLSDGQRKNLQEECQEGTKIRLRICPMAETQTASVSQPQNPLATDSHNFYQTDSQPSLIAQSLNSSDSQGEMAIVFRSSSNPRLNASAVSGQTLRPVNQNEPLIPAFRGIPAASYADTNTPVSQVSAIDNATSTHTPVENQPGQRYSSFYDPFGQYGNAKVQWRTTVPRLPIVYEARPNSQSQVRGVYRQGGAYYSVQ